MQLDALEIQLKGLLKVVEVFVRQRREVAASLGDFGDSVTSLSSSEFGKTLSACLSNLGEVEKKAQEIVSQQAGSDEDNLELVVDEYLRIVGSVKASSFFFLIHIHQKALFLTLVRLPART